LARRAARSATDRVPLALFPALPPWGRGKATPVRWVTASSSAVRSEKPAIAFAAEQAPQVERSRMRKCRNPRA
jgi:hypothetical protein